VFSVDDEGVAFDKLDFPQVDDIRTMYPDKSGSFEFLLDGFHGGVHDVAGVFGIDQHIVGKCFYEIDVLIRELVKLGVGLDVDFFLVFERFGYPP
jgi:hypothetical protein